MKTPGRLPITIDAVSPSLKSPNRMCAMAALATSGTAWTRSVPTICDIGSAGYSSSNMMMISEPEPTEVSPTTRPPRIPMTSVGSGRTTTGVTSLCRRFRIGRTIRPVMTARSAIPSAVLTCDCSAGPASMRLRSMTPRNADGIDPAISQATSRRFTVPWRQ